MFMRRGGGSWERPHRLGRGWGWKWLRRRSPHGHGHGHGEQSSTSGWKYDSHHQDHHEPEYHPPVRPEKGEEGRGDGHVRGEEGEYGNVENVDGHGHSSRLRPSRHRHQHHQGNDGYVQLSLRRRS
ncbi:unnamed protein product [Orchesella dallaii]|uniref:Uncharacterized protein n=1 Tax=Orchesella dallaii TaxID=48710 RepID=A0ABP1RY99_9HEXA